MKKEFYFVRHGQTDYNLSKYTKLDHPSDTPLNATGRRQAESIEPLIASLPVHRICCSPLRRAQETKELIAHRLLVPRIDLVDLGECNSQIWQGMSSLGSEAFHQENARNFLEQVKRGLEQALSGEGIPLIVSHGGVHFAICSLLDISGYEWRADNCAPAHFYMDDSGKWIARKITGDFKPF